MAINNNIQESQDAQNNTNSLRSKYLPWHFIRRKNRQDSNMYGYVATILMSEDKREEKLNGYMHLFKFKVYKSSNFLNFLLSKLPSALTIRISEALICTFTAEDFQENTY